jgi:hypothetical protein
MAMACLRLVTLPPLPPFPLRNVPRFRRRIARSTSRLAARLYLRLLAFFLAMSRTPLGSAAGHAGEILVATISPRLFL